MTGEYPLNRRETFSVSMVIFIGLFYLLSLVLAFFQTKSIPSGRLFGITELKFLFQGILYWYGAVSFFRVKSWGWVICTATLFHFVVVISHFLVSFSQSSSFNGSATIVLGTFLLMVSAFICLFSKDTRNKFSVTNGSYLLVICVYGILLGITFLL